MKRTIIFTVKPSADSDETFVKVTTNGKTVAKSFASSHIASKYSDAVTADVLANTFDGEIYIGIYKKFSTGNTYTRATKIIAGTPDAHGRLGAIVSMVVHNVLLELERAKA